MEKTMRVCDLFDVRSGDYHATHELEIGTVPLISCGNNNNGLVGYFDISPENVYKRAITVAYNGQPLTSKFHPYKFGAKDDVAVLVPHHAMWDTSLIFVAALLNNSQWRYSYGRKCFKEKLKNLRIRVPVVGDGKIRLDEASIAKTFPQDYRQYIPKKENEGIENFPTLSWQLVNIEKFFTLQRGDFHSIAELGDGRHMTVSRVANNNGVIGYFECPEGAKIYPRGLITISTVSGNAFVQIEEFIATDNVIVCVPKDRFRVTTLFFIAFTINYQRWRYSYGRQCYKDKLSRMNIYLPFIKNGNIDEDSLEILVEQVPYWSQVRRRFDRPGREA